MVNSIVSDLFNQVYEFIDNAALIKLEWPAFNSILDNYRKKRAGTIHAYVDTLPILTCLAAGGPVDKSIPLSAAWTCYLLASMVFDDIQDREDRDSLWQVEDIRLTISIGLFSLGVAKSLLAKVEADVRTFAEILSAFGTTMSLASSAQAQQLPLDDLTVESYFKSLVGKTGTIFATGAWSGVRLTRSRLNPHLLDSAYQFGLNAGIAGQITDDCLDLKQGDLANRKMTLSVIYAMSNKRHPSHPRLVDLIEDDTDESEIETRVTEIYSVLEEMGAVEWSLKAANVYSRRALAALKPFPRERITPLVEYVTGKPDIIT